MCITPTANRNSYRVARLVGAVTQGSVLRPQPWAGETQLLQSCCCLRAAVYMYSFRCCCLRAAVCMYPLHCCCLRAAVYMYSVHCCCLRALHFPPCHCQYIGSGSSPLPWDSILRRRYWRGAFSDYFCLVAYFCIIRRDFSLAKACISTATSSSSTISTPVMVSIISSIDTTPRRHPYSSTMIEMCSRFSSIFSQI